MKQVADTRQSRPDFRKQVFSESPRKQFAAKENQLLAAWLLGGFLEGCDRLMHGANRFCATDCAADEALRFWISRLCGFKQ